MKKLLMSLVFVSLGTVMPCIPLRAQDPITLIIKEGVKKVIVAMDLKIQRLQNETIWLQNAQKAVENELARLKLEDIAGWVQKQRDLYQDYFAELQRVKSALIYYHKVKEILELEGALAKEYRRGVETIKRDPHFSLDEVRYATQIYSGILEESLNNLEGVGLVLQSFTTEMNDAARLAIIRSVHAAVQKNLADLKGFTAENAQLSLQRAKDDRDITKVKSLYNLK